MNLHGLRCPIMKGRAMNPNNTAAKHDILTEIKDIANSALAAFSLGNYPASCLWDIIRKCDAALAAPPRNYDVGMAKEQSDRFYRFCDSHFVPSRSGGSCKKCPLWGQRENCSCQFVWANLPYVGEDGK